MLMHLKGWGLSFMYKVASKDEWDLEMWGCELRKIIKSEQEGDRALDQRLSLAGAQVCGRLHWGGLRYLPKECNIPVQAIGSQRRF